MPIFLPKSEMFVAKNGKQSLSPFQPLSESCESSEKRAEGVPEALELSDGSRAPAERKIVGESITYGQAHRL